MTRTSQPRWKVGYPATGLKNEDAKNREKKREGEREGEKNEDVPLVEFMYLVFTRMPGESYRRRLRSLLLYLCYVFQAVPLVEFTSVPCIYTHAR